MLRATTLLHRDRRRGGCKHRLPLESRQRSRMLLRSMNKYHARMPALAAGQPCNMHGDGVMHGDGGRGQDAHASVDEKEEKGRKGRKASGLATFRNLRRLQRVSTDE